MPVATPGLGDDFLVLSLFFDHQASTGPAAKPDWPRVDVTKVSSDLGLEARAPKVSSDLGPEARTPRVQEKLSRISQFMRKFPAKWQEAVHHDEGSKKFFAKWFEHTEPKDPSRAMHLFFHWLHNRLPGTIRSVDLMCVDQMPLVFQGGKRRASFRLQDLPEDQVPLRPTGQFCSARDLQGYFVTTDFEVPESMADSASQVTLRYHGTNMYALSMALATGKLASTLKVAGRKATTLHLQRLCL
jgi:hypothetical protein